MFRSILAATLLLCLANAPSSIAGVTHAPPGPPFRKVSELVKLPDFLPGMGTLYVDPKTLPVGPFLAYDHSGRLVSTIYMVPLKDFDAHKKLARAVCPLTGSWEALKARTGYPFLPLPKLPSPL